MAGRLAANVYVLDDDGQVVWFAPGDDVPEWAARQITNESAWAEAPAIPAAPAPAEGDLPAAPRSRATKGPA